MLIVCDTTSAYAQMETITIYVLEFCPFR